MSVLKKIIGCVLCIAIAGAVFAAVALRVKSDSDDGYTKTIVYIGDSISETLLGASPLSERDSYGYYALVGRRNNFRYVECAISGDTIGKMYEHLVKTSTTDLERQYWVANADILHISILGNDLLGGNIGQTAYEALMGDYSNINTFLDRASTNFKLSIERVKELNPNAFLMVNTLYNPLDVAGTLLSASQRDLLIDYADGDETVVRRTGTDLVTRLNSIVHDYLAEHPGAYEIIDVYTAFDDIYNNNYDDGVALFYGDWLHPSNEGHSVIANLIQAKLEEKGLAEGDFALPRYKTIRAEQIERLYKDTTVDVAAAQKAIFAADSCQKVSSIYFKAVRGVTPIYTNVEVTPRKGKIFDTTKVYNVSSLILDKQDYVGFIDVEQSSFIFRDDGTFTLKLAPESMALVAASAFLYVKTQDGGFDLNDVLGEARFGTGVDVYIKNIWPGFDFRDLKTAFELIKSCGIYVNGLDFNTPEMMGFLDSMQQNLTIPEGFILPTNLSIELKGYYFIDQAGDFTNIHMCVGNVSNDGFPFLYATLHKEADGTEWIETSVEVSKVTVKGQMTK